MSVNKTEQAIDAIVDRWIPARCGAGKPPATARCSSARPPIRPASPACGRLYAPDAVLFKQRVDEIAHWVCEQDPRTRGERRTDAMIALAAGHDELACECDDPDCAAAHREATPPVTAVVHVVAHADTVGPPRRKHGWTLPDRPTAALRRGSQLPARFCPAPPAFVIGGGIMPAPLLSAMLERATVREIRHPGDAPPEPGYMPSPALADFVRCRDLTCRWPGCDRSAYECDLTTRCPIRSGPPTPQT